MQVEIEYLGIPFTIEGEYTPGEPEEMYDGTGGGYPRCHYPKTYTEDLKLGYRTFERWYDLLEENNWFGKKDEFMKIYHEMLDIRFK